MTRCAGGGVCFSAQCPRGAIGGKQMLPIIGAWDDGN